MTDENAAGAAADIPVPAPSIPPDVPPEHPTYPQYRMCSDCGVRATWRIERKGVRTEDGSTSLVRLACSRHLHRICWGMHPTEGPSAQELIVTDARGAFWDPVARPFERAESPDQHTGANHHQDRGVKDSAPPRAHPPRYRATAPTLPSSATQPPVPHPAQAPVEDREEPPA